MMEPCSNKQERGPGWNRPNADIAFGHQHAVATIMTASALQSGQRQNYDPASRTITAG
jgi:hypothetical protein